MAGKKINPVRRKVIAAIKALREEDYLDVIDICNEILLMQDDHPGAHSMLFTSLYKLDQHEEARQIGGRAAELNPTSEFILNNQACLQLDANHPAAAAGLLRTLIKQNGRKAKWLYNLGLAQRSVGSYQNALDIFSQTLDVNASHSRAAFQLADLYDHCGMLEQSTRQFNYLRLLRPHQRETRRWYIDSAAKNGNIAKLDLQQEIKLWGNKFIPDSKPYLPHIDTKSNSIKLGFIVGAIPLSWWKTMIAPTLNHMSAHEKVILYWQNRNFAPTQTNEEIEVVESLGSSDSEFAKRVRREKTEVIIDVCGMRAGCRQRALGLKLANRQFGWLAHEGFYVSDVISPLDKSLGRQRFCFDVPKPSIPQEDAATDKTLFGINCAMGLGEKTVATWSQILLESDGWSLSLDVDRPEIVDHLKSSFRKVCIEKSRVKFQVAPNIAKGAIVLDNLANNDVTKVELVLRKGATVVALEGDLFQARQTAALLKQVGKPDWIVKNRAAYKDRALKLIDMNNRPAASPEQLISAGLYDFEQFIKRIRKLIRR